MIDDVEDVRRMLAPANPCPAGSLNGSSRDAIGRAALAQVTASTDRRTLSQSGRRVRLPRTGVRLAAVGVLAVMIAAGVTVAQNLSGVDQNGKPRPVVPGLPAGPVANAQDALNRAADSAQARSFTAPRNDQWIYTETRSQSPGKPQYGQVQTSRTPLKTEIRREWIRADGRQMAWIEDGKLMLAPTGGAMPPSDYASLAALPHDPDALLAWCDKEPAPLKGGRYASEFALLTSILGNSGVLPPPVEATIYRALAKIPVVTLNKQAVDVAGRPALSLSYAIEGWLRKEILLDRTTYTYLGERSIAIKDHSRTDPTQKYRGKSGTLQVIKGGTWKVQKGTIDQLSVRTAAGIVDRPGQRP